MKREVCNASMPWAERSRASRSFLDLNAAFTAAEPEEEEGLAVVEEEEEEVVVGLLLLLAVVEEEEVEEEVEGAFFGPVPNRAALLALWLLISFR